MTEDGFIKHVGITAMCVELMDCVFLEEVCYDIKKWEVVMLMVSDVWSIIQEWDFFMHIALKTLFSK